MRKAAITFLLVLVCSSVASAQTPPPAPQMPSVKLPAALDRVLRDYEKAWQARDAAALAALFTEDGFVLSNGKPAVRGRAAIEQAYSDGGGPLALRALAYSVEKNTGYIIGAYASNAEKPDEGKFILAVKKVKGRWLIAADMDNSNRRPKPPAAAAAPAQ